MSAQTHLGTDPLEGRKFYALISGGKDSLSLAHFLANRNALQGCVFVDTQIAVPGLEDFIRTLPYSIEVYKTSEDYDRLVTEYWHSFPHYGLHQQAFNYLKGRGFEAFKRAHKGEDYLFATGVRKGESPTRKRTAKFHSRLVGVETYAPLLNWTDEDVWSYIRRKDLRISPAYPKIHISGDCLCGAFARRYERVEYEICYPEVNERFNRLEDKIHDRWGNVHAPTKADIEGSPLLCQGCTYRSPTIVCAVKSPPEKPSDGA